MHTDLQNEKIDALAQSYHDLRQEWDTASHKEALTQEKLASLEQSLDHHQLTIQKMQTAHLRPAQDVRPLSPVQDSQKEDFLNYVRKGGTPDWDQKSLSAGEGREGGYLVPQGVSEHIQTLLNEESFFRKISRVTTISNEALEMLIDRGDASVGWVQEKDPREETETPELTKVRIPVHELYARPRATQRLLDDAFVNVESWIAEKVASQMANMEMAAFVNGDGDGKPRGFLHYERTREPQWEHLQAIRTGVDGAFPEEHPEACLLDLFHSLKPAYLTDAVWLMSRSTQAAIRKLKDPNQLHYLWQPSLSHEMLPTLLGYPVYVTDHMPALTPGTPAPALAFGNFKQGYQVVDRQGLHILRDPYSAKPYVEFYTTKRVGGAIFNFEAIKILEFCA